MNTRVIAKLHAATFGKPAFSFLVDFWESAAGRVGRDRAEERACMDQPDFGWSTALRLFSMGMAHDQADESPAGSMRQTILAAGSA